MKKIFSLILLLVLLTGCASVTAYYPPNTNLEHLGSIYIIHFSPDKRHLERIIADDLTMRGYRTTYGEEQNIPENVDIIVTYADHWAWDITNYMLDIEIEFRRAEDKTLIASGKSYRPSLQRTSPKKMIKETIDKILQRK